jgi:hypothetical protein
MDCYGCKSMILLLSGVSLLMLLVSKGLTWDLGMLLLGLPEKFYSMKSLVLEESDNELEFCLMERSFLMFRF